MGEDRGAHTEQGQPQGGIQIRNLYKIFGPRPAEMVEKVKAGMSKAELNEVHGHVLGLKNINLTMQPGQIHVVMGLSGSGKSTLIRHINRLIDPTVGEVLCDGEDVCQMSHRELREFRRFKAAMVFQRFALLPHRTVLRNVLYGLEVQGVARKKAERRAQRWIARVGLEGYEDNYPNQLSGGMQQRVGLARALANDADILLMDEAFSALDPLIRTDMQTMLAGIQEELHKTVVFITHDLDEALRLGDRIAVLRDGEIVQEGTGQQIVLRPMDGYIADFVKEVNRGRVIRVDTLMDTRRPLSGAIDVPSGAVLEDAVRLLAQTGGTKANVVGENGLVLGGVTLHEIMAAMVTPPGNEI